jgi:hypothetical protein
MAILIILMDMKKRSFLSFEDVSNPSPFWPFHAPARSCLNFYFFLGVL